MNKLIFGTAATVFALAAPAALQAQALPAATVAVVDRGRIFQSCTACTAANTQLQAQGQQLEQRVQQLGTPLQTEAQALQAAIQALPQGQQPDAALQARARAFQTSQENAEREVAQRREQIQRNRLFVLEQIEQRMNPIIVQVMQQRGANIAVDRAATLAINPAVDVTDAVLASLNQQLTTVNVNAPAPAPAAQPPAQQQPPRPQGR